MNEAEMKLLMWELYRGAGPFSQKAKEDILSRALIVTPFGGNYGQAGWVMCLNGSPPRGTIVSLEKDSLHYPPAIFYLTQDKSRRIGEAQARVVRDFVASLASADRNSPAAMASVERDIEPVADASISIDPERYM